jgi:hypothetical protein
MNPERLLTPTLFLFGEEREKKPRVAYGSGFIARNWFRKTPTQL